MFLGRRQVADDEIFLHRVHHQLVRLFRLAGVELDRFVDVLVLLLGVLVVGPVNPRSGSEVRSFVATDRISTIFNCSAVDHFGVNHLKIKYLECIADFEK